MSEKEYVVYDFKKAGIVDGCAVAFAHWIAKSSQVLADSWSVFSERDLSLASNGIRTLTFQSATENCEVTNAGCVLNVEDDSYVSLWHVNQKDMHRIVAELLNHPDDFELPEREPTRTEVAMCELFLETLAKTLGEGWPDKKTVACKTTPLQANPKRMRLFESRELITSATLTVTFERGNVEINWVMPKEPTTHLLEKIADVRAVRKSVAKPDAVIEKMPVEVVCVLGTTSVSMKRLSELSGGDVLQLNQKIDQPVVVMIDGRPFYRGWPGRVGKKQGIEIESICRGHS